MATQTQYWTRLIRPGIIALVGAGGKTTVLSKLVEYGRLIGQPTMVTTTTKLYESQVAQYTPYYGQDINAADAHCVKAVQSGKCAAWFQAIEGTKVTAVLPQHIDDMAKLHPQWQIIVEADGAREKWLKAPKSYEPVIPSLTRTTMGLVNLQMLGMPLDENHVHNLDGVTQLVHEMKGTIVTSSILAQLVVHPNGLFQYSCGERMLFCTGYDTVNPKDVEAFIDLVADTGITQIILADGYKASCEISRIIQCR